MDEVSGVLPVDKPEGPTSHDVVAAARRGLRIRRIGHTGTLDPFASGLLLLCIGPATRLAEYLTPLPKRYRAVMRLGEATDTDDLTGEVVRRSEGWRDLDEEQIRASLLSQSGTIRQLPPVYSAKKVGGERMYAAARRGEALERTAVEVTIYRAEVLDVRLPDVEFEVECSSGTYIRAIARDAGDALAVGGHLRALRRTASGSCEVSAAVPLEQLNEPERVRASLLSPAEAVAHLPRVVLNAEGAAALAHGRSVAAHPDLPPERPVALLSESGELLAIGEPRKGMVQPRKVFI